MLGKPEHENAAKHKKRGSKAKADAALQGQSSEKSSQDRLSLHEREDCGPGDAPVSSLRVAASTSSGVQSTRTTTLWTRHRSRRPKPPSSASQTEGPGEDPDWSPGFVNREEEVSCTPQTPAPALSDQAGSSKACQAVSSSKSIEFAQADAASKKQKALESLAKARMLTLEATRAAKRQRLPAKHSPRQNASTCPVMGARLSVLWPNDNQFYKGSVVGTRAEGQEHQIEYDSKWSEWLSLGSEQFKLLLPRGASAGCCDTLLDYLRSVDAEGLCHDEHAQPVVEPSEAHPREADTLGWVVKVWCPADGQYHQGQLISFRAETGRHHVLYEDGEDEWLELSQERLKWLHHLAKPLHAGLLEGSGAHVSEPKACVGWGVSVYWRAAGVFQEATVSSYDTASGQHALVYASGEEEELHLGHQCLKWCHPPAPEQADSLVDVPSAAPPQRRLASKASRPRSSRALGRRQGSWKNLRTHIGAEGHGSVKAEPEERGPVNKIFEYIGPVHDKSPMLSSRRPSLGFLGEAGKAFEDSRSVPGSVTLQRHLGGNVNLGSLDVQSQVVTDTEESALWRMGSPFRGFEFAPEPSLTKLEAHKAESDPESHLGASLEDKHLAVIDRPATAPSPVPLLDTANHTAFSESLLIAEDLHCDSPLPSHLGSGHVSTDSLDMCEDYLDINVLMDAPVEAAAADWYSLQPI